MGLRSLFQLIGGMVMLAITSFYLFSLNIGLMGVLILPIFFISRKVKKLSRESQDKIADASALAAEILNAVPTPFRPLHRYSKKLNALRSEQKQVSRQLYSVVDFALI